MTKRLPPALALLVTLTPAFNSVAQTPKTCVADFDSPRRAVLAPAFSPDGRTLASGGEDAVLRLHEVPSGRVLRTFERGPRDGTRWITSVAFLPGTNSFAPGAAVVAGYDDGKVLVWNVETQQQVFSLDGPKGGAVALAASPDGRLLAAAGQDEGVVVLDVNSKRRTTLPAEGGSKCVAFSPDGRVVAVGNWGGTVTLWDYNRPAAPATLRGHLSAVTSVAFSGDGKTLATGSSDNTTRLWALSSHEELLTLRGHTGAVRAVAFSPKSDLLVTASEDGTVRLW